ncbi:MAG TPA: cyclic nucleotide-binding domain-containing protein [Syntrophales bacterium]|nr:cyclic nucleotide-binding domain-containing protein [Syntrophales bacterium]
MVSTDILKKHPFFKSFSDEELKELAAIATEESYKEGFQLWKRGEPAKNLYLLEGGRIVLVMHTYMGTTMPPVELPVDMITGGDAMGWSAVIEPYIYTLGARCVADSQAIVFEGTKLRELLNSDPSLGFKFMQATVKLIATRLVHTESILVGERGLSVLGEG